ncbi:WXG100 family type VII secretion target [Litorihabitans aurantiacus]|uniref:WXG100 family type VII secretion target n=1 Tax=Litorihabitans aurantiacus TaxID=1930061 RepID=A0AA38CV20_9MICO|nr:hypothetical protein [Litorihabitans aurantiacus]GMA33129.1 hypothetical protein GCM10025875_31210 [Litorihabitans aurantiacus]
MIWTIIEQIRQAVRDVEQLLERFRRRIDLAAAAMARAGHPSHLVHVVQAAADLVGEWQAAADWVADALDGLGDPAALDTAAGEWDAIPQPLRDVEDRVRDLYSRVGGYWEGSAADAYTERVSLQREAIAEAGAQTGALSAPLRDVKAAILAMAGAVLLAILTLVGALVAAWTGIVAGTTAIIAGAVTLAASAAAVATGIGAPLGAAGAAAAWLGIAGGVATVLGAIGAALLGVGIAWVTLDNAGNDFGTASDSAAGTFTQIEGDLGTWPWLARV